MGNPCLEETEDRKFGRMECKADPQSGQRAESPHEFLCWGGPQVPMLVRHHAILSSVAQPTYFIYNHSKSFFRKQLSSFVEHSYFLY